MEPTKLHIHGNVTGIEALTALDPSVVPDFLRFQTLIKALLSKTVCQQPLPQHLYDARIAPCLMARLPILRQLGSQGHPLRRWNRLWYSQRLSNRSTPAIATTLRFWDRLLRRPPAHVLSPWPREPSPYMYRNGPMSQGSTSLPSLAGSRAYNRSLAPPK